MLVQRGPVGSVGVDKGAQRLGTRAYCMPIGEHTWTDGERYL